MTGVFACISLTALSRTYYEYYLRALATELYKQKRCEWNILEKAGNKDNVDPSMFCQLTSCALILPP